MSGQKNYISSCIWLNSHRRGHGHDFTVASSGCWIFLYVAFNIYFIYIIVIIYLNVELFIDAYDGELLMWNLTRGIYTRGAEDICAGTQ